MTDNVHQLHSVPPPKDVPLAEQMRIMASAMEWAEPAPQTAFIVTMSWNGDLTFVGHSILGEVPNPFVTVGVLEAVKKSVLGG